MQLPRRYCQHLPWVLSNTSCQTDARLLSLMLACNCLPLGRRPLLRHHPIPLDRCQLRRSRRRANRRHRGGSRCTIALSTLLRHAEHDGKGIGTARFRCTASRRTACSVRRAFRLEVSIAALRHRVRSTRRAEQSERTKMRPKSCGRTTRANQIPCTKQGIRKFLGELLRNFLIPWRKVADIASDCFGLLRDEN